MAPAKSAPLIASCALARPSSGGCKWCGKEFPPRRRTWCGGRCAAAFWNNHWWPRSRRAAKRRGKGLCAACGKEGKKLEVNHKIPCRGAHGILSCSHHLDNLETLCVPCHRSHTSTITRAHRVK